MKIETTLRTAFLGARIKTKDVARVMPLITQADTALRCGNGIHNQREWNAHLKLRTYNQLKMNGVMA